MTWTTAEKNKPSQILFQSPPLSVSVSLLWTLISPREKYFYLRELERHSDSKPQWFVLGKSGFMGRSVWAIKAAPTD